MVAAAVVAAAVVAAAVVAAAVVAAPVSLDHGRLQSLEWSARSKRPHVVACQKMKMVSLHAITSKSKNQKTKASRLRGCDQRRSNVQLSQ